MPKKWKAARILFYSFYKKCDNHLKGSCHRPQDPERLRTVTINRGQSYPLGAWDSGWHKWQLLCSRKWAWCLAHATHTAPRSPRRERFIIISLLMMRKLTHPTVRQSARHLMLQIGRVRKKTWAPTAFGHVPRLISVTSDPGVDYKCNMCPVFSSVLFKIWSVRWKLKT